MFVKKISAVYRISLQKHEVRCYTDYMKKTDKPLQGKFVCSLSPETLKKRQMLRTVLYAVMLALFIFPPVFIKQAALAKLTAAKNTSLIAAYLILFFFTAVWLVVSFAMSLTRCKLRGEIYKRDEPKLGFEKHTWSIIEWQFYLTALTAVTHLAMTIYAFSALSLIVLIFSVGAAVAAYFIMDISKKTYTPEKKESTLTYIPLEDELKADEPEISPEPTQKQETKLKTYSPDAEKNLSDDVEDFYDK